MKARRVADMSTAQLLRRAAAYKSARPSIRAFPMSRGGDSLKGVDTLLSLSPIIATTNTNGACFLLNGIAPGSGSFNRVGRKTSLKSLRIKGGITFTMTPTAAGVVNHNAVRMVIVWDKQPNSGSLPTFDTIFGYTLQDGTEASLTWAQPRYDNLERFQVLKDKAIDVQTEPAGVVTTGVVDQWVSIDEYIGLGGRQTTFSGQSAPCTVADISTGALYVYFRAQNNAASATAQVDADTVARLRYMD